VYVAKAAGGAAQAASFLANSNGRGLAWSPDGKYLLYATNQRTEASQLARIDLTPRTPRFREDQFRDLFKEEPKAAAPSGGAPKPAGGPPAGAKPAPQPAEIVFDNIRRRLSFLPTGLDGELAVISPDGKTAVLLAAAAGQQNLYSYSLDELAKEPAVPRQLTSTPGGKSAPQFTPDSKEIFYLDRGGIFSMNLEQRQPKALAVTAEMDVDFSSEKMAVFEQAWTYTRDTFFDPKYNGVDWKAVHATYEPLIAGAATPEEMRRLLAMMVGELNASHMGAGNPQGGAQSTTGRLGVRFDRAAYESTGKLKITEVIPLSPADVAGIKPGDMLDAVDGVTMDGTVNLDEQLDHKTGKRVLLKVSGRDVPVQPITLAAEKNLLYRAWVEQNRAYVAKISNGRLGYVHMQDMSAGALERLHLDLDAENHSREGVVIDIRNNSGGFVNAYALDVFTRRPYMKMTPRGSLEAPARTALGQRALEAPTALVTNQHSLSDAEDFTEGYRALKLGKVVGEPTAGWIIYTSNVSLLDGTSYRLPFIRIRDGNGADMELHPRPVDVPVSRPVGEAETGKDSQLDAAVKTLLEQLVR
jgi:C-terminal processing protease CtpA/Prc